MTFAMDDKELLFFLASDSADSALLSQTRKPTHVLRPFAGADMTLISCNKSFLAASQVFFFTEIPW